MQKKNPQSLFLSERPQNARGPVIYFLFQHFRQQKPSGFAQGHTARKYQVKPDLALRWTLPFTEPLASGLPCLPLEGQHRKQHKKGSLSLWPELKEPHCSSLTVIVPNKIIGRGTVRRGGFAGVGVALLEEACHCGDQLWGLICTQTIPSETDHFLLPEQDSEILATAPAPCLPAHRHVPP